MMKAPMVISAEASCTITANWRSHARLRGTDSGNH
jgi:hypothetical protein